MMLIEVWMNVSGVGMCIDHVNHMEQRLLVCASDRLQEVKLLSELWRRIHAVQLDTSHTDLCFKQLS